MELSVAMQALAVCDRLEEGIKNGDQDAIQQTRDVIRFWLTTGHPDIETGFATAFRCFLSKFGDGNLQDLAIVLMAVRCMAEVQVSSLTGGQDESADTWSED